MWVELTGQASVGQVADKWVLAVTWRVDGGLEPIIDNMSPPSFDWHRACPNLAELRSQAATRLKISS